MNAAERIDTTRLVLRRPERGDASAIFARYASDPEVTRYLGWPRHVSIDQSHAFLAFSDEEWTRWPAGPYLICSRADGAVLGGTGLAFETSYRASTGYVLARDAWGRGYATEAVRAMIALAASVHVQRLYALCHTDHAASAHVLDKCGFAREAVLRRYLVFPNLDGRAAADVFCYASILA